MVFDEFGHADGEVDRRALVGDFHLAPGTVGVEEHEQIGGSVAPVLAVAALDPPRLRRDRRARLADQLDPVMHACQRAVDRALEPERTY